MSRCLRILLASLFLASALPPMAAAQDPDPGQELSFTDAAGDAGLFGVGPTGAVPPGDALDLLSFRLYGEDTEGLFVEIGVKDLKAIPNQIDTFGNAPVVFETNFKVEGSNVQYFLTIFAPIPSAGAPPTGTQPAPTNMCVTSGNRGGCANQRAIGSINWDTSKLNIYVPKASLLGKDAVAGVDRQPAGLAGLLPGTRLTNFVVNARANFPYFNTDRMPDAGTKGPYILAHPAANDRIRLRLTNAVPTICPGGGGCVQDYPQVAVSPDSTALVQVSVENLNGNKRIIDLDAAPLEKDAAKWEMRVLDKVTVPGSETRVVNLIVNVSRTAEHRESILARVTAKSLGFSDEIGSLRIRLVASIPPSPRAGDLFLHARSTQSSSVSICTGGICGQGSTLPWMNTLEKDPRGTGDAGIPMRQSSFGGLATEAEYLTVFRMDTPLNADLVLNPNDRVNGAVHFRTQYPMSGTVTIQLLSDTLTVGSGNAPYNANGPTTVSFAPLADAARVAAGTTLTARIILRAGPTTIIGPLTTQLNPQIVPQGSKITLPVIPDPTPKNIAIPLGPAFLTLSPKNESEQFVNPDKIKVFQVTLVNEGVQEDLVTITPEIAVEGVQGDPDWYMDLRPGSKYRLKPGDSATFGVMVRAPEKAAEGDQARIMLNATSSVDPGALAQAFLTAIVTRGVEMEDEGENYTVDEDTIEHYEVEADGGSPAPTLIMVVTALSLAALGRRSRRRGRT